MANTNMDGVGEIRSQEKTRGSLSYEVVLAESPTKYPNIEKKLSLAQQNRERELQKKLEKQQQQRETRAQFVRQNKAAQQLLETPF